MTRSKSRATPVLPAPRAPGPVPPRSYRFVDWAAI